MAQIVTQFICYVKHYCINFTVLKSSPQFWLLLNRPIGENSPMLVTLPSAGG
jgi:hypothetical protein